MEIANFIRQHKKAISFYSRHYKCKLQTLLASKLKYESIFTSSYVLHYSWCYLYWCHSIQYDNTMSMNNEKEHRKLFPHVDKILILKFMKLLISLNKCIQCLFLPRLQKSNFFEIFLKHHIRWVYWILSWKHYNNCKIEVDRISSR